MATTTELIRELKSAVIRGDAYNDNLKSAVYDVNAAVDKNGTTLLHLAAQHNRSNMITKINISRGANVEKKVKPFDRTPSTLRCSFECLAGRACASGRRG